MSAGMFKAQVTDQQEWLSDPVAQAEYQEYLEASWSGRYPDEQEPLTEGDK